MTPPDAPTWLALLVLAPVLEEVIFRAGLQEALLVRGWRPAHAVAATALAFALAHCVLRGPSAWALATAAPAWVIGWVYQRGRRLMPCIGLHALCNGVWAGWAWHS